MDNQQPDPQAERDRLTKEMYRRVFLGSDEGRIVLGWILQTCGFLKEIKTEEQRAAHNWGVTLLENLGCDTKQPFEYGRIIEALASTVIGGSDARG